NFGKNPQAPMQLFNLENDVHEDCDVSEQHPDIVEQMEIFIKQAHVKSDLFPYPFEK
ncbi:MAG TPA: arylsulfatase, partial [Barnesiella intestinihominis]|nr:arylsulfatase [Barnesiella intestinihominis]